MLYHTAICVHDVARTAAFYDKVLAVLGYRRVWDLMPEAVGWGEDRGVFWAQTPKSQGSPDISRQCHFAFGAKDEATVRAFYDAALAAGGKPDTPPAAHPEFSAGYFGGRVWDIDGNKIEILVHPRP
ncbi:MAG: VOC family protein [Hyphomonadaceae bacterium]|nr:VOC family protein [Hyphomonadaceae bacterium]